MDGHRLGAALRAVRLRAGLRQADVARRAGVSDQTVSRLERGRLRLVTVRTLEAVATALDIRLDVYARWRGGELDRMVNAGHASMHDAFARVLAAEPAWELASEVSFSIFGERGVIDALAFHQPTRTLLVVELKTAIVDVQGLLGSVDRYVRLAPRIAADRGWHARSVSAVVLVKESRTNRRHVADHAVVLRAAFPQDGRSFRPWLAAPDRTIRALSFLPSRPLGSTNAAVAGGQRVRRPRAEGG